MEKPNFPVNVRCFTYNQSGYITDAMNGFCMQQTNFPFICCIVDDASTDGEQAVIRQYVEDNFDLSEGSEAYHKETDYAHITYARHKTNRNCYFAVLYLKENHYKKGISKKKNEYLEEFVHGCKYNATCEGDDYWINETKLQKQVDFLEEHPDYGAVYTDFYGLDQETGKTVDMHIVPRNGWQFETMLGGKLNIWTLTICYRVELQKLVPSLSRVKYFTGDILLFLTITSRTKVYCLNEKTAVYRILRESASHFTDPLKAIEFQYRCRNDHIYFLDLYPNVSTKVANHCYRKQLNTSLHYALLFNKPEVLNEIKCPFNAVNGVRSFFIYLLWKFAGINRYMFKLSRSLVVAMTTFLNVRRTIVDRYKA